MEIVLISAQIRKNRQNMVRFFITKLPANKLLGRIYSRLNASVPKNMIA
jgi:hypothetical protein